MEIRTAQKTLPSRYFTNPRGEVYSNMFSPAQGVTYPVKEDYDFNGTPLKVGQGLKLLIKNNRIHIYQVVPIQVEVVQK